MIVDKKLLDKLSVKDDIFDNGISMYLPNFDKIILYTLACLHIVITVNNEILKNINLIEQIKNRDIYQYLKKYNVYKNKYFT